MDHIPSPISNPVLKPFEYIVNSAAISGENELLLLEDTIGVISCYQIEPFQNLSRIFLKRENALEIHYMKSNDAIVLLNFDEKENEFQVRILMNWRPNGSNQIQQNCSISPEDTEPEKWRFQMQNQNEFQVFLISSFKPSERPSCKIYNNSLLIHSESAIIIWDIIDKPVLRCIILLPLPVKSETPLVSFRGDYFALVTKGVLFIIKILEGAQVSQAPPFSMGANSLKLEERELYIDFGLWHEKRNILFIERHLPERNISLQINFQLTIPGIPKNVSFLSDKIILLMTSDSVLGCIRKISTEGKELYDPTSLCNSNQNENIAFNDNYVLLYNSKHIDIITNPQKSCIGATNCNYSVIFQNNFQELVISNICVDEKHCIVIGKTPDSNTSLYILKFEDVEKISMAGINSNSLEAKMIGIHLLDSSSPRFADTAFDIAFQLLKMSRKVEALPFLVKAFNYGTKEQRSSILSEISKFEPRMKKHRLYFIEGAEFKEEEITDDILKDILSLERRHAALKLIQAHKFENNINLTDQSYGNEGILFQAINASLTDQHQTAKELFLNVSESLISTLDDVILSKISKDLNPAVLVRLGKHQFDNDEWSLSERKAAFSYMNKFVKESIDYVSNSRNTQEINNDRWHFSEWPTVPKLCKWIKGDEKAQFIAGCVTDFTIPNHSNEEYSNIIAGINLAKSGQFKLAFNTLQDKIKYPINFFREFAKSSMDWVKVMKQLSDNEELCEAAIHFLIANSPKNEFYSSIENCTDDPELNSLFAKLKNDDLTLIQLLSVEQ